MTTTTTTTTMENPIFLAQDSVIITGFSSRCKYEVDFPLMDYVLDSLLLDPLVPGSLAEGGKAKKHVQRSDRDELKDVRPKAVAPPPTALTAGSISPIFGL